MFLRIIFIPGATVPPPAWIPATRKKPAARTAGLTLSSLPNNPMERLIKLKSRIQILIPAVILSMAMGGCQYFGDSFESLASLDRAGKNAQAIEAYQAYLQKHPATSLGPEIYYRIARNYDSQSDYTNAITWYEKILGQYPHTDEELHALLDLASLYRDKIKNPAKAMEYSQRAFDRYMDNIQIGRAHV